MNKEEVSNFLIPLIDPEFSDKKEVIDELNYLKEQLQTSTEKADKEQKRLQYLRDGSAEAVFKVVDEQRTDSREAMQTQLERAKECVSLLEAIRSSSSCEFNRNMRVSLNRHHTLIDFLEKRIQGMNSDTCIPDREAIIKVCERELEAHKASCKLYSEKIQKLQSILSALEVALKACQLA